MTDQSVSIVWLRRDLRVEDNPALASAMKDHDRVVLLYVHAPQEESPWQPGAASNWWLHHSLCALADRLTKLGNALVVRSGDSAENLIALSDEVSACTVFWNRLYDPVLVRRDRQIRTRLRDRGMCVESFNGSLLREPWQVHKDDGTMYRVYTPFSRKYFDPDSIDPPLEPLQTLKPGVGGVSSVEIDQLELLPKINWDTGFHNQWQVGERAAWRQLEAFLDHGIEDYSEDRDIPACEGVSRLSPHLHFGEISPRQIWHAVRDQETITATMRGTESEPGTRPYLRQLIWRDFAHHILFHRPETSDQPFNGKFENFQWQQDDELLHRWQRGQTGIPIVDAGMRQLWHTGWMHNRLRMVVASLLTKNGLIHWREGAKWFWDTLVDADLANNSMGWQWVAGCGVDAAPYFRIFNPVRQGERFDPDGEFVKLWVPEVAGLERKYVNKPWQAPKNALDEAGIKLGRDYPLPMVDLSDSRKRALERFKALR